MPEFELYVCHSRNSLPLIRSQGKFAAEHTRLLDAHAPLHNLAECAILVHSGLLPLDNKRTAGAKWGTIGRSLPIDTLGGVGVTIGMTLESAPNRGKINGHHPNTSGR